MAAWILWAIAAVLLAVGEIFTPGLFFLGPVALAAVAAGLAAVAGAAAWLQGLVFVLGALASLGLLRPIAKAHLSMPRAIRTGTAALEGAHATVLAARRRPGRTRPHRRRGVVGALVRSGEVFDPGAQVEVARIEGATALVYR